MYILKRSHGIQLKQHTSKPSSLRLKDLLCCDCMSYLSSSCTSFTAVIPCTSFLVQESSTRSVCWHCLTDVLICPHWKIETFFFNHETQHGHPQKNKQTKNNTNRAVSLAQQNEEERGEMSCVPGTAKWNDWEENKRTKELYEMTGRRTRERAVSRGTAGFLRRRERKKKAAQQGSGLTGELVIEMVRTASGWWCTAPSQTPPHQIIFGGGVQSLIVYLNYYHNCG